MRVLGAEPGGDQRVGDALDDEGGDRQRVGVPGRAEQRARRRCAASPSRSRRGHGVVVGVDGVGQPMRVQLVDGGVEGDGADHVGRAGLLPFGRVGPHHLVEVDEVDGAAAGEERVAARRRRRAGTDEDAGAERGVHLVAAPGHEVGVGRAAGRCGASWAASTSTGTPRSWAAAMMASSGGSQPVTFDAPVMASSRGRGAGVERGDDVVDAEGAVGAALDVAARRQRAPTAAGWRGARPRW